MKRRTWLAIIIAVVIVGGCLIFAWRTNRRTASNRSKQQQASLTVHQKRQSKANKSRPTDYSTDEWMLMGYMAYAHDNYVQSRHVKDTADLVKVVREDLSDGALKVSKTGLNDYSLTNKFGSVDLKVGQTAVKVTGDGTTVNAKTVLKQTFAPYADQIGQMTKNISSAAKNKGQNKQQNLPHYSIKQLAILAGFARGGKSWVRDCINYTTKHVPSDKKAGFASELMCYGYNSKNDSYYIRGNGDATTSVVYKLTDNTLITKHNEMTGPSVAQSPMIAKTYSLRDLTAKYYATPQEREEVDELAQKLLSEKELGDELKQK